MKEESIKRSHLNRLVKKFGKPISYEVVGDSTIFTINDETFLDNHRQNGRKYTQCYHHLQQFAAIITRSLQLNMRIYYENLDYAVGRNARSNFRASSRD